MIADTEEKKRLFVGLEVHAPWPIEPPQGRIIEENERHLTLAFLGNCSLTKALQVFNTLPHLQISPVGIFSQCLFLPEFHPRLVAWHIEWLCNFIPFQSAVEKAFVDAGLVEKQHRDFLSHVTLCRAPFEQKKWEKYFVKMPMYANTLHLYESVGSLHYVPCASIPFPLAFVEIEHTADIAFRIRAKTVPELFLHAQLALGYHFNELVPYYLLDETPCNIEEVVGLLNKMIAIADSEQGVSLKAISLHGDLIEHEQMLEWEMIVDV